MHTFLKILTFTLLLNITIQVRGEIDYLSKFFETQDPNDLHPNAIQFLHHLRNYGRADADGHWCCAVTPPSVPVFSSTGNLLYYQEQSCPDTHLVCCKGYINIQNQCFSFSEIADILPAWQTLFATLGSSMTAEQILGAIHQIG